MPSPAQIARSRLANATRWGTPEEAADARRDLAAVKLEASIGKITADAPPLTTAQRERLAALILEGVSA